MSELAIRNCSAGLDRGNVSVILGMLQGIHDEVNDDEIMVEVAATVEFAITQLRHLQQLAYDTMIEIDAERGVTCCCRSAERKKPN